ncbi:MAG TPA: hypothetical protein VF881_15045 [Polyangiaceae bacterium]
MFNCAAEAGVRPVLKSMPQVSLFFGTPVLVVHQVGSLVYLVGSVL